MCVSIGRIDKRPFKSCNSRLRKEDKIQTFVDQIRHLVAEAKLVTHGHTTLRKFTLPTEPYARPSKGIYDRGSGVVGPPSPHMV